MREIKFRVWDREKQHWSKYYHDNFVNPRMHPQFQLMQFTGLKDKNGVEIYEGDIIGYLEANVERIGFYRGAFWTFKDSTDNLWNMLLADVADICEVIGNIYENPELMK